MMYFISCCCDLLKFHYLCGRITNILRISLKTSCVVICSNFTTFAVESPTTRPHHQNVGCCDLLKFHYLCGRITNKSEYNKEIEPVVICSNFTTFAVESPTSSATCVVVMRCDLLKFHYLCGRITNLYQSAATQHQVVICSNFTTFAVESPTLRFTSS